MKTLVVYFSKTGTTAKVAQRIIQEKNCDFDEIQYDEQAKTIQYTRKPSDYEHIILLSPVWAFSLAEPMKLYIIKHGADIKSYDLIVTCAKFGLRGCVRNCKSAIGKRPAHTRKCRAKDVQQGAYEVGELG